MQLYLHMYDELIGGDAVDFVVISLLSFRKSQMFDFLFSSVRCDRNEFFN